MRLNAFQDYHQSATDRFNLKQTRSEKTINRKASKKYRIRSIRLEDIMIQCGVDTFGTFCPSFVIRYPAE